VSILKKWYTEPSSHQRVLMVRSFSFALVLASSLIASAARAEPVTVTITQNRSSVSFVSDAPGERILGTADALEGEVRTDLAELASTSGTLRIPVERMETGNALRDRHLRSDDWLNAEAHPFIVVRVERLEDLTSTDDGDVTRVEATAVGTIEIHGVSQPMRSAISLALNRQSKTVRIQPTFSVALADHQISGRDNAIGDTVGASIDITGTIYGAWE
jgi:polyisoprenoid-binding protein YceI